MLNCLPTAVFPIVYAAGPGETTAEVGARERVARLNLGPVRFLESTCWEGVVMLGLGFGTGTCGCPEALTDDAPAPKPVMAWTLYCPASGEGGPVSSSSEVV